jgi:hypothetical protein
MPKGELEQLRQRKKELLLESDINRQILQIEFCQLKLKASEWKRGLLKARTAYHWVAPIAGIGFAIYGMKKKLLSRAAHVKHNGHGRGKAAYLNLLAPLGAVALRKAFAFWKHARKRNATA